MMTAMSTLVSGSRLFGSLASFSSYVVAWARAAAATSQSLTIVVSCRVFRVAGGGQPTGGARLDYLRSARAMIYLGAGGFLVPLRSARAIALMLSMRFGAAPVDHKKLVALRR